MTSSKKADKSEAEIPLLTKFEEEVFRLNDQVKYVRSNSKSKHVKTCRKGILDNKNNNTENTSSFIEDTHSNVDFKSEEVDKHESLIKYTDDFGMLNLNNCFKRGKSDENMSEELDTPSICNTSTPKGTMCRKRGRKRGVKSQTKGKSRKRCKSEENKELEAPGTPLDFANLSLPTPMKISPSMVDMEEDDQSSDEELPLGITPMKYSNKLNVKDIVWVKWGKWPYLPAMVKNVYPKKRRLTIIFFGPENEPVKPYTVSMGSSRIIPYHDPRGQEILNSPEDLSKEDRVLFNASVQRLTEFFMKKASNESYDDWSFFKDVDLIDDIDIGADISTEVESKRKPPVKKMRELSKKGQRRKEKMKEKTKELTNFVLSDKCKEHLIKVYEKAVRSERHQIFLKGSAREKLTIKHTGFGPIDDDEQVDEIILTFHTWFKEINKNPYIHANNYVFDVWVPEAIVFGLKELKGYSTKKAWEMFSKGVKSTKEELSLFLEWMTRKSPVEEDS